MGGGIWFIPGHTGRKTRCGGAGSRPGRGSREGKACVPCSDKQATQDIHTNMRELTPFEKQFKFNRNSTYVN